VPPDIVPVKRVSPIRVKKRTVWRERPEGEPIDRGREWFSHDLFVADARTPQIRGMFSGSCTVHTAAAIGVLIFLATQSERVPAIRSTTPLVMPVMLSIVPVAEAASPQPAPETSAPAAKPVPLPPAAPPPPATPDDAAAPPLEAPSSIAPEPASQDNAHGVEGGVDGGVAGGTVGGVVGGAARGAVGGSSTPGPLRLGPGVEPPQKIKEVKPVYPGAAIVGQQRGVVVIEATVDVDGKVYDARVINSVPPLDEAALTAVRQWEFLPARRGGQPVAVIIRVAVQFAIY
jgi:protein TonB